ncbi:hypothetical protein MKW35_17125, partial [Aestuariibaculum sp. L182]|nr:hypothetical protein [Aestuariibaculum lutulentum]
WAGARRPKKAAARWNGHRLRWGKVDLGGEASSILAVIFHAGRYTIRCVYRSRSREIAPVEALFAPREPPWVSCEHSAFAILAKSK